MHTMTKINEREGTEEWMCLSCGRHLLVSWNPVFKDTVILEGDLSIQHTGIQRNAPMTAKRDVPAALLENPRLKPWLSWMEETGFEDLWNGESQ